MKTIEEKLKEEYFKKVKSGLLMLHLPDFMIGAQSGYDLAKKEFDEQIKELAKEYIRMHKIAKGSYDFYDDTSEYFIEKLDKWNEKNKK